MDLHLTLILLAIATLCGGLALLVGHPLITRVLAIATAILGGVVLVANLV